MVTGMVGNKLTIKCGGCGKTLESDVSDIILPFVPDFKQYENLVIPCDCGTLEIINVNIPVNDTDEPFRTGDLPLEEEIARFYVRSLQREVRSDFVEKAEVSA
jgi:hypothetical protein